MKKTILFTGLILMSLFTSVSHANVPCDKLPAKMVPHTPINDFANVIDEARKARLVQTLTAFYDSTKISIVVVTISSLGYEEPADMSQSIGQCWGVGDKATDWGIVMMFAPNDRKMYISTGYGMEGIITDDEAFKDIVNGKIIPKLKEAQDANKQDSISAGIVVGVDALIRKLGTMSKEDRLAGIKMRKEAQEKADKEGRDAMIGILLMIVLGILVSALSILFWRAAQKRKLVNAVRREYIAVKKNIAEAHNIVESKESEKESAPTWAKKEIQDHKNILRKNLEKAMAALKESGSLISNDPNTAMAKINTAKEYVVNAEKSFNKIEVDLRNKVKKFRDLVPAEYEKSLSFLQQLGEEIVNLQKQGYKFTNRAAEAKALWGNLIDRKADLDNRDVHKDLYEFAVLSVKKGQAISVSITEAVNKRKEIEKGLPILLNEFAELLTVAGKTKDILDGLKKKYPKSSWLDCEVMFDKYFERITSSKITKISTEIQTANSLDVQEFEKAATLYVGLAELKDKAHVVFEAILYEKFSQERSKVEYPELLKKCEEKVVEALSIIKNSDVENEAKELAKKASGNLKQAKLDSIAVLVNWILLLELLYSVIDDAMKSIRKANDDISSANTRRRQASANTAAVLLAAAKKTSRNNESTYTSNISIDTGGGGGFGGFGGGSFGGGGAGGSW